MACRDCEWWKRQRPLADHNGRCDFPMPHSVEETTWTFEADGEGCPQFKERENGE